MGFELMPTSTRNVLWNWALSNSWTLGSRLHRSAIASQCRFKHVSIKRMLICCLKLTDMSVKNDVNGGENRLSLFFNQYIASKTAWSKAVLRSRIVATSISEYESGWCEHGFESYSQAIFAGISWADKSLWKFCLLFSIIIRRLQSLN